MSTCRLCLGYNAIMDIFFHDRRVVLKKFLSYSKLKMQKHDGLPENICLSCVLQMEATVAFISKCEDSDRELRSKLLKIKIEKSSDISNDLLSFTVDDEPDTPTSTRRMTRKTKIKIEEDSDNDNLPLKFLDGGKESDASDDIYQDIFFDNASMENDKKDIIKETIVKVEEIGHLCNVCGEHFAPKLKLAYKNHMLTHGEKQFKCTKCPKAFFTKKSLTKHGRAHVETKNFACEYCGKAYKSKKTIITHIKFIHQKKNQYTCEYCKRTFFRPDYFKRHMSEMHRVEQNYVCRTCHKSFPFLNLFQLHKFVHTGEKEFSCNSCPSKFISRKLLADHQKTHIDNLIFHCHICYKGYSQQHHLKIHMTKMHRDSALDV